MSTPAADGIRYSVCAHDCPDTCSVLVTVKDGRATRIRGNPAHPVTRGFLCAKVARYLEREYSPLRLRHPMRRSGAKGEGRLERISWDEAIAEIAGRFQAVTTEFGAEAILPYSYAGTTGLLNGSCMDRRFFHRLGASRLDRTICAAAGCSALDATLGSRCGVEPEQFVHSRLIIAWGANILAANCHLWPFIVEARRKGARFYNIDPIRNRTGQAADRHYAIHPGSDHALALGLIQVILSEGLQDRDYIAACTEGLDDLALVAREYPPERVESLTGIPAGEVATLAREYATTQPAVIRLNYGLQRSERGGAAVRAISVLPALTGAWRRPGGGLTLTTSGGFHLASEALKRPDLQPASAAGSRPRLVNMVELGKALTLLDDPPVKALCVYNSNPAAIAPHQSLVLEGLRREDLFTVVLEQFQTDTADYADILLPATTFLEHTDLYLAYGHYFLQLARPALAPPGEARSNFAVFQALARAMGFDDDCFADTPDDAIRQALASGHPFLDGITLDRLDREHSVRLNVSAPGTPFLPFAAGNFGAPSGKCDLRAGARHYTPPVESRLGDASLRSRFPLEFLSPKLAAGLNSSFSYRPAVDRDCSVLTIHPADAAARDIRSGDSVRVHNQRGACTFEARVSADVTSGVVSAPGVRWAKMAGAAGTANLLTSDRLTDEGGGPVFHSCLVEVEKCIG